jgi:hypothetical protein
MDEFSVTLMRTRVTPGTVRYDAVGDEDASLRNVYVTKRSSAVGFPSCLLVTVREEAAKSTAKKDGASRFSHYHSWFFTGTFPSP